jgi:CMP-N-acetylneuraminic acid synthetase
MPKLIAVIPIRSGSKRFPDKNIYPINGVPLFYFAAIEAKKSGIFDKIIISSDSVEYLKLAKSYNFETHLRSEITSNDFSSSEDAVFEVIKDKSIGNEDWIFLIQATHPLQQIKYFHKAKKLIRNEINSIITYREFRRFFIEDIILNKRTRTQDYKPRLLETGLFWSFNVGAFINSENRLIEPYEKIMIDDKDDIDIDVFEDLEKIIPQLIKMKNENEK